MKRSIVFLFTIALLAGAGPVLAGGHGHGGGGHRSGSVHPGFVARSPGFVHSHPFVHPGFHRFHNHGRVIVGSTIFLGAAAFPYYYPPPAYVPPAYVDDYSQPPSAYIEQSDQVRYFCPDSRAYYPDVTTCASDWLRVVP